MAQASTNPSFGQFVAHVFDHPVEDPQWYWNEDAEDWYGSPGLAAEYCARLFQASDKVLRDYSDAQVGQGLWYLVSNGCSDIVDDIIRNSSTPNQRQFIGAIVALYRNCFAIRCSAHLSHLDEPEANPLNITCYMWWDIFPTWGDESESERDHQIIEGMRQSLSIDSEACQESTLHGLGHWQGTYPDTVEEIIDEFLDGDPKIRPELRNYALSAKKGMVL